MSVEAINWAFQQPIRPSTAKFVLVALANNAGGQDFIAWPSIAYISSVTGQDRKTVCAGLNLLREEGFIEDTGERKGATKQVIAYRLNIPKNGTVKEALERNSTENGTVPKTEPNSPVFPHEQSRFSHETVPKTVHGTVRNRTEPSGKQNNKTGALALPDWLPARSWADWVEHRKAVKAPMTARAAQLCLQKLDKLRAAGHDPVAVIEQSVITGRWTDLYPIKAERSPVGNAQSRADRQAKWTERLNQVVDASLQPARPKEIDMGVIDASS
ncbi:MAG: hypothetical protein AB7E12_14130 [Burkholderiaceae bacterium]